MTTTTQPTDTFGERLALILHMRSAELKQFAPHGSAPFLSVLATYALKQEGPAALSLPFQALSKTFGDQPIELGPRAEAKLRELAGRAENYNEGEGFAQLANCIFWDLRDEKDSDG